MANKKEWHSHIYKSVLLYSIDTETKLDIYSFDSAISTFHKSCSFNPPILHKMSILYCMDFRDHGLPPASRVQNIEATRKGSPFLPQLALFFYLLQNLLADKGGAKKITKERKV